MRILGIDPGSRITGYGVIDCDGREPRVVEAGTIRLDADADLGDRLTELHEETCAVIDALHPDRMAVEKLYSHYSHPQTAVVMGHARGVILLAARQRNVPVEHYAATRVKKFLTGSGRAGKQQIQRAVAMLLHLAEPPEPPDVADALAVAMCSAHFQSLESAIAAPENRS